MHGVTHEPAVDIVKRLVERPFLFYVVDFKPHVSRHPKLKLGGIKLATWISIAEQIERRKVIPSWLNRTKVVAENLTSLSARVGSFEGFLYLSRGIPIACLLPENQTGHYIKVDHTKEGLSDIPISTAHTPVPVPISRILRVCWEMGARCNLPSKVSSVNVCIVSSRVFSCCDDLVSGSHTRSEPQRPHR